MVTESIPIGLSELFIGLMMGVGVLLNNGAAAIAKIFAGTKTTNLTIAYLEVDSTYNGGVINPSDAGATTPVATSPIGSPSASQSANICTLSWTIGPASNVGLWRRWFLHFRSDLTEGLAGGVFTNPGINHDGSGTDVLEFDIAIVEG